MYKVSSCVRPENLIGKGSFATVYRYTNVDGQIYAVKVIDKNLMSPKEMEYINREIHMISGLIHPHIVKSIGVFNEGSMVYMVFEYCANGDLRSYLVRNRNQVGEPLARRMLLQLISGVKYLYDNQIFHRDLKTQNLFLTEDLILKIGDFGFATRGRNMTKSCIGSPYYMSPEILGKNPSIKSDLWSIGIIFYELLTGTIPFEGKVKNQTELYTMILTKPIDIPNNISENARDLLSSLLTIDVNKRIDWDQLFSHKYFTPINTGDIYLQRVLRWNIYTDVEEFLIPVLSPVDTTDTTIHNNYRPLIDKYLGYTPEDTVLIIPSSSSCIVVICDKSDGFVHVSPTTTSFDRKLEYLQILKDYIKERYTVLKTVTTQLVSTRDTTLSNLTGVNIDIEQSIRSRVNIFLEGYERITKDYDDIIDKSPVNNPTYTTYISTKATKSSPSTKLIDEMNRQLTNSLKRYMDLIYRIDQTIRTYRSLLDEYNYIMPTIESILEDNLCKQYEERVKDLVRQIDEEFNKEKLRRKDRNDVSEPYHPIREAVNEYKNKYLHMSNLYHKMRAINQSLAEKLVSLYKP
jgi:serine/threonine protein kinase